MKYFYCDDCGSIFSEEDAGTKRIEWGHSEKEVYACPDCKNTYVEEADTCEICGKPMKPTGDEYCDDCKWNARKVWEKAVSSIMDMMPNGTDYTKAESVFIEYLESGDVI